MKNHGTALSEGQLAEFLGAGTKALTLIANQLGPDLTDNWARNSGAMQKAFLSALCPLAAPMPATPAQPQKLLELLSTVQLPAIGEFKAEEKFVVDTGRKAKVKIASMGSNFEKHFGHKVEPPVAEAEVKLNKLLEASLDRPIIDEAGGEEKVEISLGQFYEVLWYKQMKSDRTWVITYIRDDQGTLWAVRAHWVSHDGGWSVGAFSVEDPNGWFAGDPVVSR